MASKNKNKTVVESDRSYVLLYDTFGGGLTTFSFGLDVIRGGEELQDYVLTAARELLSEEDSLDDDDDEDEYDDDSILSIADQIVVLEVTEDIDVVNILRLHKKTQEEQERKLYERLKKKYEEK
jgi:hypothetical protein